MIFELTKKAPKIISHFGCTNIIFADYIWMFKNVIFKRNESFKFRLNVLEQGRFIILCKLFQKKIFFKILLRHF